MLFARWISHGTLFWDTLDPIFKRNFRFGAILGHFVERQGFHYVVLEAEFNPIEKQSGPLGDKSDLITDEINSGENEINQSEDDINLKKIKSIDLKTISIQEKMKLINQRIKYFQMERNKSKFQSTLKE